MGGGIPADLRCGFCKQPVQGVFYRTLNRFACTSCVSQVQDAINRNTMNPAAFLMAAIAGLAVGLGCAVAWAVIVHVTHFEIGIVASFIGVAVAKTTIAASGKKRGPIMQALAGALAVVGVAGGRLMLFGWAVADFLNEKNIQPTAALVTRITTDAATSNPTSVFSGFDLLWMGIAVFAAIRLCKAPNITIAGPFAAPPRVNTGMQFHTAEPVPAPVPPPLPEQP
jgi:hypothetical protein